MAGAGLGRRHHRRAVPAAAAATAAATAPDGWYEHDGRLYKHAVFPALWRRLAWLSEDQATGRDLSWQLTNIVIGGALALLPAVLVVGGLIGMTVPAAWDATTGAAVTAVPLGLLAVAAGLATGPALLRVHALWTRVLLQPVEASWGHTIGARQWIRRRVSACWHCAASSACPSSPWAGLPCTSSLSPSAEVG